jgi:outer membrane protein assembly factor BamB
MVRCFDAVTGQLLWSKDVPVRFENRGPTDAVLLLAGLRCWVFITRPIQIGDERTAEEMWFRVCDLLTGEVVRVGRVEFAPCFPPLLMSGDGAPQVVLTYLPAEEPLGVLAFDAESGRLLRQFSLPEESEIDREFGTFSVGRNTLFAGGYQQGLDNYLLPVRQWPHSIPVLYQFDLQTGDVLWSLIGEPKGPR